MILPAFAVGVPLRASHPSIVTTVPEQPPFAFVWLRRGAVDVFLNDAKGVADLDPTLAGRPRGG